MVVQDTACVLPFPHAHERLAQGVLERVLEAIPGCREKKKKKKKKKSKSNQQNERTNN
jgi:uncharacterized spore protein YtfJ